MKAISKLRKPTRGSTSPRVPEPTSRPAKPQGAQALFSTRFPAEDGKLDLQRLADSLSDAKHVFMASAYYDVPFCKALLAKVPKEAKSVRLVFNGLGGARLLHQRDELAGLQRSLRKRISATEIRFAFAPGIFHTKLLLAQHGKGTVAYVGSANATMAAMRVNEEILLRVSGDGELSAYADRIWNYALPLAEADERAQPRSLIAFFRTGSLYFKPTTSLQTTLNPFTSLLASMPNEEKRKLGTAILPYADQESGIGPFSVRTAVGLRDDDSEDRERAKKVMVKKYSIETCLGYWIPFALDAEWQRSLDDAVAAKSKRQRDLLAKLEGPLGKVLPDRYAEYVDAVRNLFRRSKIDVTEYLADGVRDPFDPERFTGFLAGILARLRNQEYLSRLCSPFMRGTMPEIWDDPIVGSEFEKSFFHYLEFVAQSPSTWPHAPGQLLRTLDADHGSTAEDIRSLLRNYLASNGWRPELWQIRQ